MFDVEVKRKFRAENLNICSMTKEKIANIPKGTKILQPLQSDEEFEKLLNVENWAVTQTIQSNILFFDSDPKDANDFNGKLSPFFNRRRDKYIKNSIQVNSQHGFIKVNNADHNWCIEFTKKYHLKSGIEVYAENHWMIFAGIYYNEHNLDDPKRETIWYKKDDLHNEPIMKFTKEDLGLVFDKIQLDNSISSPNNMRVDEIIKDDFIVDEGQDRENFIIKYMVSRIQKNPEFLDNNTILLEIAHEFNKKHCNPPISDQRLEKTIKRSIDYALTNLKNNSIVDIEKSVTFDLDDEHKLIINNAFKSINKLKKDKEKVNSDSLFPLIVKSIEDEDSLHDYMKGGEKHQQLQELVNLIVNHAQDEIEFLQAYLETKTYNRFTHIKELDIKNQFNCWYWTNKIWSENTAHYILESLQKLKGEEIKPSSGLALKISNNLSASEKTLQIELDDEKYNEELMTYVPNKHGQYFDLKDGKIKDVDPSRMFYENPLINLEFNEDADTPKIFLEMLKKKFPNEEDSLIFIDALASHFIHTSKLGAKPKATVVSGKTNAGKSLFVEIMKKIISPRVTCNVSMGGLGDKWALSMMVDCMSNFSEEESAQPPKDPSKAKDAITKESGEYEQKGVGKQKHALRFPRHLLMCNTVPPIPKDDDDESIYQRYQYLIIEFGTIEENKKYRKDILEDKEEVKKIMMFLLRRAFDIFNGSPIHMQTIEEAKTKHIELTQGTMRSFIKSHCITHGITSEYGTSAPYLLSLYNRVMPSKLSKDMFAQQMEEEGYEKKTRHWVFRLASEPNVFTETPDTTNENNKTQQTVIMGLKPIKISKSAQEPENNSKPQQSNGIKSTDNT